MKGLLAAAVCVSLLGLAYLVSVPILQQKARDRIVSALQHACPKCRIELQSVRLSPFQSRAELMKFEFRDRPGQHTQISFVAESILADVELTSLFADVPHLTNVTLDHVQFTVQDNLNVPRQTSNSGDDDASDRLAKLPELKIDSVQLNDCRFVYELITRAHLTAPLSVNQIQGTLGPVMTRAEFRSDLRAKVHAKLEHSGEVELTLHLQPFLIDHHDEIAIRITNQNLSELNPFFMPEDGIELSGKVKDLTSELEIAHSHLRGKLRLVYQDLEAHLHATKTRGGLKTAIAQLVEKIVIIKTRPQKPGDVPQAHIDFQRPPNTSIFKFIIEGAKPAASLIVRGKESP